MTAEPRSPWARAIDTYGRAWTHDMLSGKWWHPGPPGDLIRWSELEYYGPTIVIGGKQP
jgi:hypothetical protein